MIGFLASCEETVMEDNVRLPENLTINILKSDSNPARVTVNVTAELSNFYRYYFGETDEYIETNASSQSYTYSKEGTYTILVQAHATSDEFVSVSNNVGVTIAEIEEEEEEEDIPFGEGYESPLSYDGYNLVWQDEFDGTELSGNWTAEIGTGSNGWGNNELQYYRAENTTVADGYLSIEAKEETFGGRNYTSSRLITEGNQSFQYGRIDIRAILPKGQGLWPALWMLGDNFRNVGWPFCGEIDIMEMVGGGTSDSKVFGTLHWDNNGSYACTCGQGSGYTLSNGTFADQFHVFSIIWDANEIKWYVDNNLYKTIDISPAGLDEFREPFFLIFNIAVGGNLPGSPNSTTVFPQKMIIDYVRVFQEN